MIKILKDKEIEAELWKVKINIGMPGRNFFTTIHEVQVPSYNFSFNFYEEQFNCLRNSPARYVDKKRNFLGTIKLPKKLADKISKLMETRDSTTKEAVAWYDKNLRAIEEDANEKAFLKQQEAMRIRLEGLTMK